MWNKHGRTHLRYLRIETYGADLQLITTVHDAIKAHQSLQGLKLMIQICILKIWKSHGEYLLFANLENHFKNFVV